MSSVLLVGVIILIVSFSSSLILIPSLIRRLKEQGFMGRDMNKKEKVMLPEFGGLGVLFGFVLGLMSAIFLSSYLKLISLDLGILLSAFSTVLLIGIIGLADDLLGWKKGLKQWQHALLPIIAALPLMALKIGNPPVQLPLIGFLPASYLIPFFGAVSFSVIYSLIFVPVGVTGASNATNMLAGLNGLEAGLGAIIISTLAIISFSVNSTEAFILSIAMLGALIAFLKFNWFPAKIFPGDSLTLMLGASIASIVIIADMERIGLAIFLLYFIELVLKARTRMKAESFGTPVNGFLAPPKKTGSLTHVVMRLGKFSELKVVSIILGAQLIISLVVLFLFFNSLI